MDVPPLDADRLRTELVGPDGPLAWLDVVETSPSTNTALVERARADALAAPGLLVAEHQPAGRGRAGRTWETPPGAALTASFLLRPRVPATALGWLPLLAGLAVARAVGSSGAVARVKWPNDVLLPAAGPVDGLGAYRKVAGILAEVVPARHGAEDADLPAVVVGVGLNVHQRADQLPVPTATSLALVAPDGVGPDRGGLLVSLARELTDAVGRLEVAEGDAHAAGLEREYAAVSATVGSQVRAELAGSEEVVEGEAVGLTGDGALVVRGAAGDRVVSAGDVHHLRRG